ncbi:monocyte to macrophage differentiation factor isoform X1 [Nasonia vitripennis]|uniref:Monocyte to macrophage differentiation factor n=1 Tax=Nasonia vitripennis TaxID=7425 RepID=A0A7M7G8H2_NASVI|nr:monocyte to macrophage differentiation factor isoform X1 [Nasonia vitripennis]
MNECCEEKTLIENNNHLLSQRNKAFFKWKNEKPHKNAGYVPTLLEHIANIGTHGIFIIPAINCLRELIKRSSNEQKFIAAIVYGGSLFLVVTVSTLFHCAHFWFCQGLVKNILHRCDRAFIYIFILGTYFPWLYAEVLEPYELFEKIRAGLCVMVILGILYQQLYHQKYKALETVFYLITGLMPSIALYGSGLYTDVPELKTGALMYIVGLVFFKSDGLIPCAHAIWHAFSVTGAAIHYWAVLEHLYPEPSEFFSQI